MNQTLSELKHKLQHKNVEFRIIELSGKAMTVQDVVKFSKGDIKENEICKTIIVKADNGEYAGLVLEGSRKVDTKKVENALGQKVRFAKFDEVKEAAKVEPGAVCPLLLEIPVIVDKAVLNLEKINLGSGDHLHGIEISPHSLVKTMNARVEEISQ